MSSCFFVPIGRSERTSDVSLSESPYFSNEVTVHYSWCCCRCKRLEILRGDACGKCLRCQSQNLHYEAVSVGDYVLVQISSCTYYIWSRFFSADRRSICSFLSLAFAFTVPITTVQRLLFHLVSVRSFESTWITGGRDICLLWLSGSLSVPPKLETSRLSKATQLGLDRVVDLQIDDGDRAVHVIVELYDRFSFLLLLS